jgi:hypothetical protein
LNPSCHMTRNLFRPILARWRIFAELSLKMPATGWRELIGALASAWLTRFNPAHFNEPSDRRVECAWPTQNPRFTGTLRHYY